MLAGEKGANNVNKAVVFDVTNRKGLFRLEQLQGQGYCFTTFY